MTILAAADPLRSFIHDLFRAAGSHDDEAAQIADHLVGGTGPFAVFDCGQGYGQPAVNAVMAQAAAIAREHGVAVVTVRNAQHVGRMGAYAEQLQQRGLMSIHFVNAVYHAPTVAPFLGSDARLMTNPVCVAVPGAQPLLLDFAASTIAFGKVRVAYNKGETVAPGRLIDHRGQPTQQPAVMFEEPKGAQTAFGEHKGWALAFMAEVLGGALPGEPEQAARAQRGREGIPIDDTTWGQIRECAQALGLAVPPFPRLPDA